MSSRVVSVNINLFDEFEGNGFVVDLPTEVVIDELFIGGMEAESRKGELVIIHVEIRSSSSSSHDQIEEEDIERKLRVG